MEMDTYYMTKRNYEDMKSGKTPEVVLPVSKASGSYSIPLVAVLFHHAPVFGCIIHTPTELKAIKLQDIQTYTSKIVYKIGGSLLEKSGLYTYTCSGNQSNFITNMSKRRILSVSLYLKFVTG